MRLPMRLLVVGFALGINTFAYQGYGQTPTRPHVYVTHLKEWSASGGFNQKRDSRSEQKTGQSSYANQFKRGCVSVVVTDLEHADFAVAIDDKRFLSGLTNAQAARFQFEVYNRDRLIFAGGEDLLGKAIEKACNSIASPNIWIRRE